MADGLLAAWALGTLGMLIGAIGHGWECLGCARYKPRARHPDVVQVWITDELNRYLLKMILVVLGLVRLSLLAERTAPILFPQDFLELTLYWLLLLLLTYWTWHVRRLRPPRTEG